MVPSRTACYRALLHRTACQMQASDLRQWLAPSSCRPLRRAFKYSRAAAACVQIIEELSLDNERLEQQLKMLKQYVLSVRRAARKCGCKLEDSILTLYPELNPGGANETLITGGGSSSSSSPGAAAALKSRRERAGERAAGAEEEGEDAGTAELAGSPGSGDADGNSGSSSSTRDNNADKQGGRSQLEIGEGQLGAQRSSGSPVVGALQAPLGGEEPRESMVEGPR